MEETKIQIKDFFSRFFDVDNLADDIDIFANGYVNSLFAMQLISWIEKEFSVAVEDDDLQLTNFNSVNAITGFIERKSSIVA
ncbi:acyl carrier protein [Alteromonadaceae bacterium M269]|nr:acyl carrier protein [Alteromonadaceae bacterium M269]